MKPGTNYSDATRAVVAFVTGFQVGPPDDEIASAIAREVDDYHALFVVASAMLSVALEQLDAMDIDTVRWLELIATELECSYGGHRT